MLTIIRMSGVRLRIVIPCFWTSVGNCGMASATLKQGIEARLKQAFPHVTEVVDVTDHAQGEKPYYR